MSNWQWFCSVIQGAVREYFGPIVCIYKRIRKTRNG